jgi:hypothetical protein
MTKKNKKTGKNPNPTRTQQLPTIPSERQRNERGERREIICIKIVHGESRLVPYTLSRTVAFPMFREPIGYLLWVVFVIFFLTFFLYVEKGQDYRGAAGNALKEDPYHG